MKMQFFSAVLGLSILFSSCGGSDGSGETTETKSDSSKTEVVAEPKKSGTAELLQGKWQHSEDKSNFLVFEKNHRKEIADGMDEWDDEVFVLSDKCMNESNASQDIEKEKDRYISVADSDLCWYIVELSETNLSLSFMGRGNTLNYTRAK